ncbi:MAG: MarR family transcriptional regulator [Chloroflexota bacterium]
MNDRSRPVNRPPADPSPFWSAVTAMTQQGALHQEALAATLGLNPTDLRCIGFAWSEPDLTPGRLAELTGLTTGAVTGVLDRLERAGFVQRVPDPKDRRRTLIHVSHDRGAAVGAAYEPLERAVDAVRAKLSPGDAERLTVALGSIAAAMAADTARLRAAAHGGMVGEMFTAPVGDAREGRLVFASGAPRVAFRVAPLGPSADARVSAALARSSLRLTAGSDPEELCRATFDGPVPDIRAGKGGGVAVRYRSRLDPRARKASLVLGPAVPWTIAVGGGLSGLSGDLRGSRIRSIDLSGGVDELELDLPAPEGTSRLAISGSSAHLVLTFPRGAAVKAVVEDGAHELRFETQRLTGVHGTVRLETPGAASAPDRWEIEIRDGVRSLRIQRA